MPGSNIINSTDPQLYEDDAVVEQPTPVVKAAPVQLPKVYKTQDFNEEAYRNNRLATMYGTEASRRDKRKFNRYMQSEEGLAALEQAKQKHTQGENAKWSQSYRDYLAASMKQGRASLAAMKADWDSAIAKYDAIGAEKDAKPAAKTLVPKTDWNARAKEYGFNSMDEVKQWQAANGLAADGKFGNQSLAKWQALKQGSQQDLQPEQSTSIDITYQMPGKRTSVDNPNAPLVVAPEGPSTVSQSTGGQTSGYNPRAFTKQDFNTHKNFRDPYHQFTTIAVDGKTYPIRVTTGLYGKGGIENDHSYAFDEETGMIRKVDETLIGTPTGKFAKDSQWIHPRFFYEEQWLKQNPAPAKYGPLGGAITPEYQKWHKEVYTPAANASFYQKQGGTMNRINYFQQGGAAPKQDIKAQVTALVQAAMQGDQKATQQVNQIMEAAKAGNQQAVQLAQLITEVAKQLQGQATSAKWGSKLDYIKSLKFAKGGKTCPVCEKKVEMKACGGKKAKKRYFGGII